jgi:hypothetical protein
VTYVTPLIRWLLGIALVALAPSVSKAQFAENQPPRELTVERQLSVLVEPPGNLATLAVPANNRQTIVYRRARP